MAENLSRFIIIDGVQIARDRALRQGLIDEKGRILKGRPDAADEVQTPTEDGPKATRARSSKSTRKG